MLNYSSYFGLDNSGYGSYKQLFPSENAAKNYSIRFLLFGLNLPSRHDIKIGRGNYLGYK